jgi:hypothetical protein
MKTRILLAHELKKLDMTINEVIKVIKLNTERKGQNKRYHFVLTELIMQAGKSKLRISN